MDLTFGWRIIVRGVEYDTRSLTLAEAERAEELAERPWIDIDPRRASDLQALIAVLLQRSNHVEDVPEILEALTLGEITVEFVIKPEV